MCDRFVQKFHKPGADQAWVVVYTMAEVFSELLVWRLKHMKSVSMNIYIDTIDIEWWLSMNDQNKLEAACPKTLS